MEQAKASPAPSRSAAREERREQKRSRYIPRIESVVAALELLPDAATSKTQVFEVNVEGDYPVQFRRVKMKEASGSRYRWIYDGKVIVR